jgi:hypothetical protein
VKAVASRGSWLVILMSSLPIAAACAGERVEGPTVSALLAACDRAAAAGGRGVDAAMCEWYAAPCACKLRGTASETWCVPEGEDLGVVAKRVVSELRRSADPASPAEPAVAAALTRLYPCKPGDRAAGAAER